MKGTRQTSPVDGAFFQAGPGLRPGLVPSRPPAILVLMCLTLVLAGCHRHPAADSRPSDPVKAIALKPSGTPICPKSLAFMQDGLHNCGTIAMLISWAKVHPDQAANLVWKQQDGGYLVIFKGADLVIVSDEDLVAAVKAKVVRTEGNDPWARIVLTAFTKLKGGSGPLDFRSTDWIYAGEIAPCLTGSPTASFDIKPEKMDKNGRITVGQPVALPLLKEKLNAMRGKPAVAYTNRRVHIWALMSYDPAHARILVRNPRLRMSEWLSEKEFRQRFQLLVYVE